jgi:hypothetical protein
MFLPFGDLVLTGEAMSVAAVGLGTAGLALFLGRRLLNRLPATTGTGARPSTFEFSLPLAAQERRFSPRRRGNCVAAHLGDDSDMEPTEVWVIDRSLGGLCLLADAPVQSGSHLRVRPRHVSGDHLWTPIRVCACNRDREGWMVHCQFLQVPPMNVLLMYG